MASRGLYATGVSTDLNVTYLNSGGEVGDILKAVVNCDKCTFWQLDKAWLGCLLVRSWKDACIHFDSIYQQQRRDCCEG